MQKLLLQHLGKTIQHNLVQNRLQVRTFSTLNTRRLPSNKALGQSPEKKHSIPYEN